MYIYIPYIYIYIIFICVRIPFDINQVTIAMPAARQIRSTRLEEKVGIDQIANDPIGHQKAALSAGDRSQVKPYQATCLRDIPMTSDDQMVVSCPSVNLSSWSMIPTHISHWDACETRQINMLSVTHSWKNKYVYMWLCACCVNIKLYVNIHIIIYV